MDMRRFGTYYGGWWIPRVDPNEGIAVCVGAGLDVSFDLELLRLGYSVYTLDPTPSSVEYVRTTAPELTLMEVGVWDTTGELEFRQDKTYRDSWAISAPHDAGPSPGRRLPVTTLKDLFAALGSPKVGILKLDVEGAEHVILRSLISDSLVPACICVEFDDQRLRRVIGTTYNLRRYGYELLQIENYNFTFELARRD